MEIQSVVSDDLFEEIIVEKDYKKSIENGVRNSMMARG